MLLVKDHFQAKPAFQKVYLKPGELCVSREPAIITTILGSCICVTMFNYRKRTAAMCHAVQPSCRQQFLGCPDNCRERYKYASCVIPEMMYRLKKLGIQPFELETKLFGGAAVIGRNTDYGKQATIGQQNVEAALTCLEFHDIRLSKADTGGTHGRKILFDTRNGEVMLKKVRNRLQMSNVG
jgi:chemotaxis protein CheD